MRQLLHVNGVISLTNSCLPPLGGPSLSTVRKPALAPKPHCTTVTMSMLTYYRTSRSFPFPFGTAVYLRAPPSPSLSLVPESNRRSARRVEPKGM